MKRLPAIALSCALVAGALAGCHNSSSFTQVMGDVKIEVNKLDGSTEGFFELPYNNAAYDVEMESGTVDLEIFDVIPTLDDEDDSDPIPTDVIHEANGLGSGDHGTFSDDDGEIMVRVTSSDGATGTISIKEGK